MFLFSTAVESTDLAQQRTKFEDILKLSAQSISNKTEAVTLVKMLKLSAFVEHQDPALLKLLAEYLRPKVFQLENEDLAQLFTPLVILST